MRCLYCGTPLAILRMLANGTFCCDEHRELYEQKKVGPLLEAAIAIGPPRPRSWRATAFSGSATVAIREGFSPHPLAFPESFAAPKVGLPCPQPSTPHAEPKPRSRTAHMDSAPPEPNPPRPSRTLPPLVALSAANSWPPFIGRLPLPFFQIARNRNKAIVKATITPGVTVSQPVIPKLDFIPARLERTVVDVPPLTLEEAILPTRRHPIDLSTQKLREIWRNAPGDLKLIAMVIPMILLLTLNAAGPKLYTKPVAIKAAAQPIFDGILTRQWHSIRQSIARRAGVDYLDDFHSGLDAWQSSSGSEMRWSYDNMGFVRPGALALFRPTMQLADYQVQFTGRFEQRAMGFVFRAVNAANYQAVKLVLAKTGPLPEVHLVRYTVLNGREGPRSDKLLPINLTSDAFFNVRLDVHGSDFTLMVEEKMADFWSDERLKTGGIGFFCAKGESACLRRVEVSYQNDTLGRMCAFIASESLDGYNGS